MTQVQNDAPWVTTKPTADTGLAWRVTRIHHRTPEENHMLHNVFVTCIENGHVVRDGSLQIKWGWKDMHDDQKPTNKKCDKREPDPYSTDIPIEKDMEVWFAVVDARGYTSERVENLHAKLPGPGPAAGSDWHHQSYDVEMQLLKGEAAQPVPTTGPMPTTPMPPAALPTEEEIRNAAWATLGHNGESTDPLAVYAYQHELGAPLSVVQVLNGTRYRCHANGIVFAPVSSPNYISWTPW